MGLLTTLVFMVTFCPYQSFLYEAVAHTLNNLEKDGRVEHNFKKDKKVLQNMGKDHKVLHNVLMLIADDMRPQFGAMEGAYFPGIVHPVMKTPSLDKLASESAVFRRAYVQYPLCAPSRSSFLTGRRPDTTHQYTFLPFRQLGYNYTTLPQYFKEHGFLTYGVGKVFHQTRYVSELPIADESELAFSEQNFWPESGVYWNDRLEISWSMVRQDDRKNIQYPLLPDEEIFNKAIQKLHDLGPKARTGEINFLLSVGFHRPHIPYSCPVEYFDLYPANSSDLPSNPYLPNDFPTIAWFDYFSLRRHYDLAFSGVSGDFNTTIPDHIAWKLRRAYYACISFVDDLVGSILDEVEAQGLKDNTIVVFLGDHGYNLGENMEWTKEMLWDLSTHTPLMIRIPGLTDSGLVLDRMVEFVDIYPTLAEAAGLPMVPLCPRVNPESIPLCHEGMSLVPLIQASKEGKKIPWKNRVFTQMYRPQAMGHSMTTERYRYTEWIGFTVKHHVFQFHLDEVHGSELYDHHLDPQENVNRVSYDSYKEIRKVLQEQLRKNWRAALPPNCRTC